MLQVVQADQQSDRNTGATHLYRVQGAKLSFKERPVNLIGQTIQFMLAIKHLIKAGAKQVTLVRNLRFWLHEITGNQRMNYYFRRFYQSTKQIQTNNYKML